MDSDTITSSTSKSLSSNVTKKKGFKEMKIENPFTFKVGQVFTGFGIGCGVGIGVGRPINMGAIPVVNQVMGATRGATDAFSGVTRHVNDALRKVGAKNIEAGIGCGVGFGHGFGVGLALKPGVMHQIQSGLIQMMTKMMTKFGISPGLSIGQGALPNPLQGGMGMVNESSIQNPMGNFLQATARPTDSISQGLRGLGNMGVSSHQSFDTQSSSVDPLMGSRTEKVIGNFLQNPLLKQEDAELSESVGRLRTENNMLQMVLKHQQIIEELLEENEKLRQILIDDLKVPPSKMRGINSGRSRSPCTDCFECRRKQRRK